MTMTTLEMASFVKDKLLEQNAPSKIKLGTGHKICAYRGDGGVKCAVGHLIADEDYSEAMEDGSLSDLTSDEWDDHPVVNAVRKTIGRPLRRLDQKVLMEMQNIHDSYCTSTWKLAMENLCDDIASNREF